MDRSGSLNVYHRAGEALDRFVGRHLERTFGRPFSTAVGNGYNALLGVTRVQLKTSNALPGHVLIEHTARNGEPGWIFGDADFVVQVVTPTTALAYDREPALEYVLDAYGEPDYVPTHITKVPQRWITRHRGNGDAFIYVPTSEIARNCKTWSLGIELLDSMVQLCKTARNHHLPDDVRLAALDRLERYSP